MLDFRRIALWLIVLLVPGGVLLLPLLIADLRRRDISKTNDMTPTADRAANSGSTRTYITQRPSCAPTA